MDPFLPFFSFLIGVKKAAHGGELKLFKKFSAQSIVRSEQPAPIHPNTEFFC